MTTERAKQRNVPPNAFAETYARLGEKDQALAWLEKAYEQRHPAMIFLISDPVCDELRSDPLHAELVRRMGLQP